MTIKLNFQELIEIIKNISLNNLKVKISVNENDDEQTKQLKTAIKEMIANLDANQIEINKKIEKRNKEFRISEERFKKAFEHSSIGMALVSPEGKWLDVNSSLCEIIGYEKNELLQKTFQEITHHDDLEKDLSQVKKMMQGGINTYQIEKRYIHKKGHKVWVRLSVSLVRDSLEKPLYFVSQIENITEKKKIELDLKEKIKEMEKLNNTMIGRELKMVELEEEINNLKTKS